MTLTEATAALTSPVAGSTPGGPSARADDANRRDYSAGARPALDLVRLTPLMNRTRGSPDVVIGLIDGPVAMNHPDLATHHIRGISAHAGSTCAQAGSMACLHGTFVAGILSAKRGAPAPAICPDCTLVVRPIFGETGRGHGVPPTATPAELADAIHDCIASGARVLNVSAALARPTINSERILEAALDRAARSAVIVVAAAGNQGTLGGTTITRHPWVIPVVAYNLRGVPIGFSNFGNTIGRRGLGGPGDRITSLGTDGKPLTTQGTSAAAPFVTGAIALLWSAFPRASAGDVKRAVTESRSRRRSAVVPPLLDAWTAFQSLRPAHTRRRGS